MTVTDAAGRLSAEAGRPEAACAKVLRELLLVSSVPERLRTSNAGASQSSFYSFKLHQFISGAGHTYMTMEPPGTRKVTVDGQQFLPGHADKRLYAVHFCRECGHEYYPVRLVQQEEGLVFLARDIDDADDAPPTKQDEADADPQETQPEGEIFGFLDTAPAQRSRLQIRRPR